MRLVRALEAEPNKPLRGKLDISPGELEDSGIDSFVFSNSYSTAEVRRTCPQDPSQTTPINSKYSVNEPEQFTGTYTLANRRKQKHVALNLVQLFCFFPSGYVSLNIKAVESSSVS